MYHYSFSVDHKRHAHFFYRVKTVTSFFFMHKYIEWHTLLDLFVMILEYILIYRSLFFLIEYIWSLLLDVKTRQSHKHIDYRKNYFKESARKKILPYWKAEQQEIRFSFSSLHVTFIRNNCNKYLTHLLFSLFSFAFTVHFLKFFLSFYMNLVVS
jgi:hypothetical protein